MSEAVIRFLLVDVPSLTSAFTLFSTQSNSRRALKKHVGHVVSATGSTRAPLVLVLGHRSCLLGLSPFHCDADPTGPALLNLYHSICRYTAPCWSLMWSPGPLPHFPVLQESLCPLSCSTPPLHLCKGNATRFMIQICVCVCVHKCWTDLFSYWNHWGLLCGWRPLVCCLERMSYNGCGLFCVLRRLEASSSQLSELPLHGQSCYPRGRWLKPISWARGGSSCSTCFPVAVLNNSWTCFFFCFVFIFSLKHTQTLNKQSLVDVKLALAAPICFRRLLKCS